MGRGTITKQQLFLIQEEYLTTNDADALDRLYRALTKVAERCVVAICRRHSILMIQEDIQDLAVDAATDMVAHYLEDSAFKIESSFYSYLHRVIQVKLFRKNRGIRGTIKSVSFDEHEPGFHDDTLERIDQEALAERIVGQLSGRLSPEEILDVFPHIINIIERPGQKEFSSYLYRVSDKRIRELVEKSMQYIREGLLNV